MEWRAVIGWEGWYEVSDLGQVRRVAAGKGARVGKVLKARPNTGGYLLVGLRRPGVLKRVTVHGLVAEAFLPPRPSPAHEVNHEDGKKHRNRAGNLNWKTRAQNNLHACRVLGVRRGSKHGNAKLTERRVRAIRRQLDAGTPCSHIARQYGVTDGVIYYIRDRRGWLHVV